MAKRHSTNKKKIHKWGRRRKAIIERLKQMENELYDSEIKTSLANTQVGHMQRLLNHICSNYCSIALQCKQSAFALCEEDLIDYYEMENKSKIKLGHGTIKRMSSPGVIAKL